MKLICDDKIQTYFWVDDNNESVILSPRFDYIEDANMWYENMKEKFYSEWNKKWMKTTE